MLEQRNNIHFLKDPVYHHCHTHLCVIFGILFLVLPSSKLLSTIGLPFIPCFKLCLDFPHDGIGLSTLNMKQGFKFQNSVNVREN